LLFFPAAVITEGRGMPAWTGAGLITGKADVDRVVAAVNQTYRAGTETLAHAVQPATAAELADSPATLLPILPELRRGLPWPGLRRGATVSVVGSTSLIFALLAGAMSEGGWAAILGMPEAGVLSAQEMGVPLSRLEDGGFADSWQISMRNSTE